MLVSPGLAAANSGVGAPAAVPRLLMMKLSRSAPLRVPIRNGVLLVALVAFDVTWTLVSPILVGAASVLWPPVDGSWPALPISSMSGSFQWPGPAYVLRV